MILVGSLPAQLILKFMIPLSSLCCRRRKPLPKPRELISALLISDPQLSLWWYQMFELTKLSKQSTALRMQVNAGVQTILKSCFLVDLGPQCSRSPQPHAASALVALGCCDSTDFVVPASWPCWWSPVLARCHWSGQTPIISAPLVPHFRKSSSSSTSKFLSALLACSFISCLFGSIFKDITCR